MTYYDQQLEFSMPSQKPNKYLKVNNEIAKKRGTGKNGNSKESNRPLLSTNDIRKKTLKPKIKQYITRKEVKITPVEIVLQELNLFEDEAILLPMPKDHEKHLKDRSENSEEERHINGIINIIPKPEKKHYKTSEGFVKNNSPTPLVDESAISLAKEPATPLAEEHPHLRKDNIDPKIKRKDSQMIISMNERLLKEYVNGGFQIGRLDTRAYRDTVRQFIVEHTYKDNLGEYKKDLKKLLGTIETNNKKQDKKNKKSGAYNIVTSVMRSVELQESKITSPQNEMEI